MAVLSKKKLQAQRIQQLSIDRHVLSEMHEMLRAHLEQTGKFTAEERATWEREVMVPAFAKGGIIVEPMRAPPAAPTVVAEPKRIISFSDGKVSASTSLGPTVEPTIVNQVAGYCAER